MKSQSRTSGEREAVGILYCHGWGSRFDPCKDKIRALPVVMFDGGSHRFDHMAELIESRPDLFHTR
ncbi:hypothetical protein EI545_05440 [Tabrizicola piscis]|uniref:Alpha/beta hydrolase n=1 Tax=Tabrizicola piscis TaxID=2494374 RepID=A0A3S8U412_9RHOB|nr:hypothetical protein [Tabrizicola piscis]AZL58331.1 hypothetical protein EI545_05440 [Tabrizicola piscis]